MDTDQGKNEEQELRKLSTSLKRKIIAVIIVVVVLAALFASFYGFRTAGICITISNMDEYSQVHFALYLDGEIVTMAYLEPQMNQSYSLSVRPGTHNVLLDYDKAFAQPHVDGVIDFFQKVQVGPFYTENLTWVIPSWWR